MGSSTEPGPDVRKWIVLWIPSHLTALVHSAADGMRFIVRASREYDPSELHPFSVVSVLTPLLEKSAYGS